MMNRGASTLTRLAHDRRGATAVLTGLMLIVVLGFVGFGIDVGAGYAVRRSAQGAADSTAFTAAVAQAAKSPDAMAQAHLVAANYGFVDGQKGVTVTVNLPPTTGAYAAKTGAAEVIISRPAPKLFMGLFVSGQPVVSARAVAATVASKSGDGCVVTFNPTAPQTLLANGNPVVDLHGCSIWDNSSSTTALSMNGGAIINATTANVVGGFFSNGNAKLNAVLNTGIAPLDDPYADVGLPDYPPGKCDAQSETVNAGVTKTYAPVGGSTFVFCNGLQVNSTANVTFAPGIYVIDGGSLIFNGSGTIRGTGVTFILTNHTGSNIATVTINGGADVKLSAPTPQSGLPTQGMVFYQDRRAGPGVNTLNGGANQVFTGALYFPKQTLLFNGGTSVAGGGCTQVLADKVTFNGNARLAVNCAGVGTRGIGGTTTTLVE